MGQPLWVGKGGTRSPRDSSVTSHWGTLWALGSQLPKSQLRSPLGSIPVEIHRYHQEVQESWLWCWLNFGREAEWAQCVLRTHVPVSLLTSMSCSWFRHWRCPSGQRAEEALRRAPESVISRQQKAGSQQQLMNNVQHITVLMCSLGVCVRQKHA